MASPPPLPPCRRTPNCVSTQATDPAKKIDPIPYTGTLDQARARLLRVLRAYPRTKIVQEGPISLKAECRSRIFRFVDDVDLVLDDREKVIHFRSASRVGRRDFGVNRQRMEEIRRRFQTDGV
jgi:uncharacterized protein (DUF1499 family)